MKNIILKVPTFLFFIGLITGPLTAAVLKINHSVYETWLNLILLEILQWAVITLWVSSLVAYFSFEGKSTKNSRLIYLFIVFTGISSIVDQFFWHNWGLYILSFASYIVCVVLLTPKIKKVFYARSTWFIVIELILIPVGFLTLTPEVKRWEKGDKQ